GQAALFPLRGTHVSDPSVLRRYAAAHGRLLRRRRVRPPRHPARLVSTRARRGDHGTEPTAGEAVAAARLPRRGRSLRQHGLLSRLLRTPPRPPRPPP